MYTIGAFAAFGRVSVRMLRHYDQLGIGLERIAAVFATEDEQGALRAALEARRAELEASVADDTARLARIRRRLRLLEGTETMSEEVTYRSIDPIAVYAVTGSAPGMGPENVGPVIGPLIESLDRALADEGRDIVEPAIFWYEPADSGEELVVHVSYTAEAEPRDGSGYRLVELPRIPTAASIIHRGGMSGIGDACSALVEQLTSDGYRMTGPSREVYLHAKGHIPQPDWVTELQVPVERA
jgi:effector-binding domain-containing protein